MPLGGSMRQAMPPEFSPAADAAGAGHLSPLLPWPQGQEGVIRMTGVESAGMRSRRLDAMGELARGCWLGAGIFWG